MKLSRRIVSLLMALVMLFTMVSPVFAATLANPYTIEVTASCSNIHLDGVPQNTSGLQYLVYEDEDTIAEILGVDINDSNEDITADNKHKKADGSARQIVGWRILHRGPNGHEENDPNIYTTAEILSMTVAAKKGDIPAGCQNYIQFQAVWDDSEFLYHSNVDFSPFYGTVQWNSAHGNGLFTGTSRSFTGGRHCELEEVTTNLNTDTTNYDGDVFGKFEGWVKVEYEFAANGKDKVDINVIKNSDGDPIVYSFDQILKADANDTDFHIAPEKNVAYFAKWKNIPLSEYANYGIATEGSEDTRSFVQVDMYGGNADVLDYNTPTQNDDATLYEGQGLVRAQLPHGSAFAVRYGWLHNFRKTNDSFEGFYRYDPVKDSNGDYVLDQNNKVVYNIYTEINSQGDSEPVLYHEDVVNFGEAPEEDRIYVAKWANVGAEVYMDYHPIQEGTGIPGHPEVFKVGFHIQGGVADIAMGSNPVRTTNYDETVEISVDKDNKISDQHGSSFITNVVRTEGDGKTPIQGVTFDGWVVYIRDSSGNFGFAPNANGDPLIITSDIHEYQPEEDVFFLPKWSDIAITDSFYTDFNPGTAPEVPQQRKVTIDLGNASSVTVGIQGPPGSITIGGNSTSTSFTTTSAGKTLTEVGYTSLSAALDTTDYNNFGGWRIEDDNGNTVEMDIRTEDIMDKELPSGDITIKPLFFGPDINVSFMGATVTLTSGDHTDTPKDSFGYPSVYAAGNVSLKADGFDSVSNPVFHTAEAGDFLGWIIETMKPGSNEWIPVSEKPFKSSEIVDFVFPKDVQGVNIVAKWENDIDQLFATVMMDVLDGTATVEYDNKLAGGRTESGRIVDRGSIYGGKTLGVELDTWYPINHAHDTHGDFLGWVKAAHNSDDVFVLDESTYETPIDDADVKASVPAPGTVVLYIARWENLDLDAYKACVDSYNHGDGGEEGPQLPQIGGEEGFDIEIGEWAMETTLTIVKDGETFTDTVSSFPLGKVQKDDTLKDLGVTDISDAKFVYDDDENGKIREFVGWRLVSENNNVSKDCFSGETFTSEELLELSIPECEYDWFRIYPVWADSDHIYFASFDFDGYGGDMERADGSRDGWDGWWVPRNRDLTEHVPEHVLPKNPLKDGDEFLGWKRVPYQYTVKDGMIGEAIYDTSDENIYTDPEDLYDVDISDPYSNVVYVAVWKNLLAENPDAYKNYPEGHPGGGDSGSNIVGGFFLLAGDGSLQFSADDIKWNEHIVVNYTGYEAATLMLEEGMSINETLAAQDMENFTYNLYRKDYSFTGWDVYAFNGNAEILRVPRTTPLPENMENYIPDPYVHPVKTDFVVHEGWAVNGENEDFLDENYPVGTEFDVYSVIHEEDYELVATGFTTEEIFEADNLDEFYICVAQWEKAPETKVEVELPNIDLEENEVPVIQVQTDIQLPEIPSDANDPESEPLFESIEQVKEALDEVIAEVIDRDVDGKDKTVFMEISLMIKDETTGETTPVDPENFPDEGLDVYVPFPNGTGKSGFKFVIAHLKSTDGSIEVFDEDDYEITDKGIKIHVTSLSPFAVYYEEDSSGVTVTPVTPGESAPGRQNPNTGVHF